MVAVLFAETSAHLHFMLELIQGWNILTLPGKREPAGEKSRTKTHKSRRKEEGQEKGRAKEGLGVFEDI